MTPIKRPFDVLSRNIGKNVSIRLKGAQVVKGTFLGYDPHWNISLAEAEECRNHRRAPLGKLILRGNNVLFVSDLDRDQRQLRFNAYFNMNLPGNVIRLINDSDTETTLTTVAADGKTSLKNVKDIKALKPSVIVLGQSDAKQLDRELLNHMGEGSLVSILCVSLKEESRIAYQIICSVREFQTSGPLYEKFLDDLRARYVDLDGVWVLRPVDFADRSSNFDIATPAKQQEQIERKL